MSNQDPIREAFSKVKEEISDLKTQIGSLTKIITEIKRDLLQTDRPTDIQTDNQTQPSPEQAQTQATPTDKEDQTDNYALNTLKEQDFNTSIGNGRVPTDRQTDQQTDTSTKRFVLINDWRKTNTRVEKVAEILSSLDSLKKELRTQFKRLTAQEMLVFSTIYQLTDEGFSVDYSLLSKKLNL